MTADALPPDIHDEHGGMKVHLDPDVSVADPAELHHQLASMLRRYKAHQDHAAMIHRSATDQRDEITEWEQEEAGKDEREMAQLETAMRAVAKALLPHDPKGRKTISTSAGEVSFREGSTRIEVVDREAYMLWAQRREEAAKDDVAWRRQSPAPGPEPNLNAIRWAIGEGPLVVNEDGSVSLKGDDGERIPIPGVKLIRGEETFRVSPR